MWMFFVLLFIPIMLQHFAIDDHYINYTKKNKQALTFFFIFFMLLLMFRHENVGNDTINYKYFFLNFANIAWKNLSAGSLEIGFAFFNKIVSLVTVEPQIFFAVTAMITLTLIYPTYKRLCVDASLTIVLFCTMSTFVMMFSGVRQMLAVGIGFLAYECTRKKKPIVFFFVVLLAISFHTSAFMLFFMYPLYHARITKRWIFVIIPILMIIFIFSRQIFLFFALLLEQQTKYNADVTQTGAYLMLILFAIFAMFSFLVPEESLMDEETIGLRNMLLFSVVIQMFASLHTLAMRMNYYYIIFIPLLLPKIIACRNNQLKKIAMLSRHVMVVFFLIYFFINAYNGEGNLNVFPYHFFWEDI